MNLSGRPAMVATQEDIKQIVGMKVHELTVVSFSHSKKGLWFNCKCNCGKITKATKPSLLAGRKKSCGCARDRAMKSRAQSMITHKSSRTRLYNIWSAMRYRCNYPKHQSYANYGGRGIKVCGEWAGYQNFHDWAISNGYNENLTIDRIDNNGDYSPLNCKWSSRIEQQNNRRSCRNITINGETLTMKEWSRRVDIKYSTVYRRIRTGWNDVEAITTPVLSPKT